MSETKIEVSVTTEFKDYWRVLFWYQIKRRIASMLVLVFFSLMGLLLPISYLMLLFVGKQEKVKNVSFFPMLIFYLLPAFLLYSVYSRAKNAANSSQGTVNCIFTDDEVEFSSAASFG